MKKIVLTLTAVTIFAWQGMSFAAVSSVDALIQKLEDKGILTDQDANQIKGEIATEEQSSQQSTFKSMLPDWINGFKLSGDFRLRDQVNDRKVPLTSAGAKNLVQNRGRFRARLNLEDQINDKVKIGVTLATEGGKDNGTLGNARSNNLTFGGNGGTGSGGFSKAYIAIDKAWATYTPNQYVTLTGGKMANPIWEPASLLWDPDITPEGGVIQLQKKVNGYITPFSTNAFFVLKDNTPSTSATSTKTDPYMFITQDGIKGNLTDQVYYKVAGSYYDISNPNHFPMDNSLSSPNDLFRANGTYQYNYGLIGGAIDMGINDPFGDILPSPLYVPQVGVFGQYFQNIYVSNQNAAWMIGGYMGNSAINGWGTWKIQSFYKVLERNSWMSAFPDDDFYSGDVDTQGWRTELDMGLAKNVWFVLSYFHTNVFKHYGAAGTAFSKSAPENLFQMDLDFKF